MAITINVNLDEILQALKDDLDFTGNADKYIKVNATADGFEFAAVSTSVSWGEILGLLSDQTDLQNAFDLKANLSGAAFTGDVSVTTSGSGDTLQLTNSGSGTTLNIVNSGSGDFLAIDTNKLVVSNNGNLAVDTNTLFVDATNNRVGIGTATPLYNLDLDGGNVTGTSNIFSSQKVYSTSYSKNYSIAFQQYYGATRISFGNGTYGAAFELADANLSLGTQNVGAIGINGGRGTQITNILSPTTVGAVLKVLCATTDSVGAIIQAAAGQTANLQEWRNSSGTVLSRISNSGQYIGSVIQLSSYIIVGNVAIHSDRGMYTGNSQSNGTLRPFPNGMVLSDSGVPAGKTNDSVVFELTSTSRGFLPPVMTGAQVEAIATPAEGLIAYATSAGTGDVTAAGWWGYNGSNWVSL